MIYWYVMERLCSLWTLLLLSLPLSGLLCQACSVRLALSGLLCQACCVWLALSGLLCLACSVWLALSGLLCLACSVWLALSGLLCQACFCFCFLCFRKTVNEVLIGVSSVQTYCLPPSVCPFRHCLVACFREHLCCRGQMQDEHNQICIFESNAVMHSRDKSLQLLIADCSTQSYH